MRGEAKSDLLILAIKKEVLDKYSKKINEAEQIIQIC